MMERALKERIVGAVILVALVVLVVPIFLDGPPGAGETVSQRVLLPGQEDQDIKTVVLDRERSVPIPAVNTPADKSSMDSAVTATPALEETAPAAVASDTDEQPAQPAAEKPPVESVVAPPPVASSTTGMWAVQLGSFSDKQNAEKLAADLRRQGYVAFLSRVMRDGIELHRVRIGPQENRARAEVTAAKLEKVGHKGQVVPHP